MHPADYRYLFIQWLNEVDGSSDEVPASHAKEIPVGEWSKLDEWTVKNASVQDLIDYLSKQFGIREEGPLQNNSRQQKGNKTTQTAEQQNNRKVS